jgi:hypothetical protein
MKRLALRTVLPAFLAIILFTGVVFQYLLPSLDRVVMDQKRLMIRELTEASWNILASFAAEEEAGNLTREQAQAQAVAQVRSLHYGAQEQGLLLDHRPTPQHGGASLPLRSGGARSHRFRRIRPASACSWR